MATSPTSATTKTVQELKTKQIEIANKQNDIVKDELFIALQSEYNAAAAVIDAASKKESAALAQYGESSPEYRAAVAERDSAVAAQGQIGGAYIPLWKEQNQLAKEAKDLESQITQAAATPIQTSPVPNADQRETAAAAVGNAESTQKTPTPVPTNTPAVTPPSSYVPNRDNNVSADSLAAGGPTAEPTSRDPQSQSSVSNEEFQSVDSGFESGFPEKQITVEYEEFQSVDSGFESGFPKKQITVEYEEFQSNDLGFESGFPEERKEIDSSDRYVATLDLTATDDPLGDKIAELQAGQQTGTSTLPTRNQQSGIGSPKDWRFRMSLAPSANYLYKAATPGILKPLMATNGVIFPYSPNIVVSYNANYNSADLVHTNYKIYNYKNSSIESVSVTGEFTCQDSAEANYVLAVIHFFKSVTKMFYGQDQNPTRGTPPPLVYLTGFGQYQFDMHPVVVTSFTHTFPADVDYVNAYPTNNSSSIGGQNMAPYMPQIATFFSPLDRLRTLASNIVPGGRAPPPTFINSKNINEVTRVPAKITIQLTCLPIITRNAMSNSFSLQKYASGELMRGSVNFNKTGGGIW